MDTHRHSFVPDKLARERERDKSEGRVVGETGENKSVMSALQGKGQCTEGDFS